MSGDPRPGDAMPARDTCEAVQEALFLGRPLDGSGARHLAACGECRETGTALAALAGTMASARMEPPAALAARVHGAVTPLLTRNARRATWRSLARAVGFALVPLPLLLFIDAYLLRTAYGWLSTVLPDTLSLFLVLDYTALLALLLTLAYGAIPLLTERQLRLRREESYG